MLFRLVRSVLLVTVFCAVSTGASGQPISKLNASPSVSTATLLQIIRAEDERRWNSDLLLLFSNKNARVRERAALAAGRIGDERAVPQLAQLLRNDTDSDVRQMAAFSIGEIESSLGADALLEVLEAGAPPLERAPESTNVVRGRALEALGKITLALPESEKDRRRRYGEAILKALRFEAERRSQSDRLTILLGLTADLRARPDGAGPVIARFLSYADPRIVADALNTLTRLRLKDGNREAQELLVKSSDPIVRANAARVLGATEEKQALDALLDRALHDQDLRVRVSAIRALGSLKDERAVLSLARRGSELLQVAHLRTNNGAARNEALEILTTVGLMLAGKPEPDTGERAAALTEMWLGVRAMSNANIPEAEIAQVRARPDQYLAYLQGFEAAAAIPSNSGLNRIFYSREAVAARATGLSELARMKPPPAAKTMEDATLLLRSMLNDPRTPVLAIPNILEAYALFKPSDLSNLLRQYLRHKDVIVRATAAELLSGLPEEPSHVRALIEALPLALRDTDLNDAALAILDALAKQKNDEANAAIMTALDSSDHLIRRRAVALLKANGVGDFSNRIGLVQTRNTEADYRRAIRRIGKSVTATVETSKGAFVIEFLAEDAPLTVDNFIQLAKKGFFNGQTIPRVVPNFVIQAGDPRGDTNGGPGYQIRCEINEVPYERAAVGMALSGKDTGGSQWFVTHSPQPHLDGGYTVFGRVVRGMEVVDNIARGDTIRRVVINEH